MANLSSLFNNNAFDPSTVEPMESDFSPIPKGAYPVVITESEIMPNKAGTGTNLTLKLVVQDGKHKNRILFDNLCVQHQNQVAQQIAQTKLAQICQAVGIGQLQDTDQLHDKQLIANVDVDFDEYQTNKHNNGEKYYRNAIKSYAKDPNATASATQAPSKPKAAKAAPALADGDEYDDDRPF